MKSTCRLLLPVFLLLTNLLPTGVQGQFGAWTYEMPVTVRETEGTNHSPYQALIRVNTAALVNAGKMQADGADIRFYANCGPTAHWIADFMNTDSTLIWVMLDTLAANDSATVSMLYGNPAAAQTSDFAATFPTALVSGGGNLNLSGTQTLQALRVDAGDTLFIGAGSVLDLSVRYIEVNGVVMGEGRGNQVVGLSTPGTGPGGGGTSTNAGSGGGGYGGAGGGGGFDSGDSPGAGGAVYGTPNLGDIAMGSTGGSSSSTLGGAGGGCFRLESEHIVINGTVNVNGGEAQQPGGGQGGGGGSGGGMLLIGDRVFLSGNLTARGGNSSIGTSTANDDGGGGGGGRLKVNFDAQITNSATLDVSGGSGGINGSAGTGVPGQIGTTNFSQAAFNGTDYTLSSEILNQTSVLGVTLSDADTTICPGEPFTMTASSGFTTYTFSLNGNVVQSGSGNAYTALALSDGDLLNVEAAGSGCTENISVMVSVIAVPTLTVTASDTTGCAGDSILLVGAGNFGSFHWDPGNVYNDSTWVTQGGDYYLVATDSNGCVSKDTIHINLTEVLLEINGATSGCEGDTLTLDAGSGHSTYLWSTSGTGQMESFTSSGTIWVEVTDGNGCSLRDSLNLTFNAAPVPVITNNGGTLETGANYSSYQWLSGGTAIGGATSNTYTPMGSGVYSVEVTDSNGCTGVSDTLILTIGVDAGLQADQIRIWPNPAEGKLQLSIVSAAPGARTLQVIDLRGRVLIQRDVTLYSGENRSELDLEELSAGTYLLRIGHSTIRFVKQ